MKSAIILCLFVLPASVVLAQGPRGGGGGFRAMGRGPAIVTGAPYSGIEIVQTQETLADGNHIIRKRQTTVYRDSQGRLRSEETITPPASSGKTSYTAITIIDPVAGTRYMLDSSTMTYYQTPLPRMRPMAPAAPVRTPMARDGATVVTASLGTASVNGVAATGTQITETIAAGAIGNAQPIQIVRITWISNDLKIPVQIKSSDPRFGTTDMELTNLTTSEPNASLFVVPAGYTAKSPAGMRGGGPGASPNGLRRGPGPGPQSRGTRQAQ
ncbi:MAG: hypothetical protein ABJC09_03830 [Terriglobia bacterium]